MGVSIRFQYPGNLSTVSKVSRTVANKLILEKYVSKTRKPCGTGANLHLYCNHRSFKINKRFIRGYEYGIYSVGVKGESESPITEIKWPKSPITKIKCMKSPSRKFRKVERALRALTRILRYEGRSPTWKDQARQRLLKLRRF